MNSQIINNLIKNLAVIFMLSLISETAEGSGFDSLHQHPGLYSLDCLSMLGGGSQKSNNYAHQWAANDLTDQFRNLVDRHIEGISMTKPEVKTNEEWIKAGENDHQSSGREKLNIISAGFGLPEMFNIGLRSQLEQVQIGLSIGGFPKALTPDEDLSNYTASVDVRHHFGGLSELSNRRPWYGKIGLIFWRQVVEGYTIVGRQYSGGVDDHSFLDTRIGRDFNLSNKLGIYFEIGASWLLTSDDEYFIDDLGRVFPGAGIGVFIRTL